MKNITIHKNPETAKKIKSYPKEIQTKLNYLRQLIIDTASENDQIEELEETLKWGEPSYLVKKGSTIRIDWKAKTPDQYAMYFKCTSKLVKTFKEVYPNTFNYEKTRAIVFKLEDKVPKKELKLCINSALMYHTVKDLPNLGMR